MTADETLSLLDAQIEATTDPDTKAALQSARDAFASTNSDAVDPKPDDALPAVTSAKAEAPVTHAEGDDEKKKDEDAPPAKMNAHSAKAVPDAVAALTAQVMRMQRDIEVNQIDGLLAKHANLPEDFKAHCRKGSLEQARANISAVAGVVTHSRKDKPSQGSTDGSSALDPRDADLMDRQMGLKSASSTLPHKMADGRFVLHNVRPSDMARLNAQKAKA